MAALVYLDPPFKSARNYNVLFVDQDGTRSPAQIQAFEATWRWDQGSALAFQEVVEGGGKPSQVMQAFRTFLGENDMLAYLSMMAPRLIELRRVMKETASIYLHCDPAASHYLKLLLDAVLGPERFVPHVRPTAHLRHVAATSRGIAQGGVGATGARLDHPNGGHVQPRPPHHATGRSRQARRNVWYRLRRATHTPPSG